MKYRRDNAANKNIYSGRSHCFELILRRDGKQRCEMCATCVRVYRPYARRVLFFLFARFNIPNNRAAARSRLCARAAVIFFFPAQNYSRGDSTNARERKYCFSPSAPGRAHTISVTHADALNRTHIRESKAVFEILYFFSYQNTRRRASKINVGNALKLNQIACVRAIRVSRLHPY